MTTMAIILPIIGGIYGAFLGAYIKSTNKTPKRKITLWIAGVLLLILCIIVLYRAFAG